MLITSSQLADYGLAAFLIGGIVGLVFYWLKQMIPSWQAEKTADAELKRSLPQLAENLREVVKSQREVSRSLEGILVWAERIHSDFDRSSKQMDEKLDALLAGLEE